MATTVTRPVSTSNFPRFVLRLDGAVATASGLLMIAGARPISAFLGLESAVPIVLLGVISLPYAVLLFRSANQQPITRRSVRVPVIANAVWVMGTIAMLLSDRPAFSAEGKWAVAVVADIGGIIAILQFVALRRMARASA